MTGVVVDAVRQPPILDYHPKMVAAYQQKTGVDARTIDASAGQAYQDWIRWRARASIIIPSSISGPSPKERRPMCSDHVD